MGVSVGGACFAVVDVVLAATKPCATGVLVVVVEVDVVDEEVRVDDTELVVELLDLVVLLLELELDEVVVVVVVLTAIGVVDVDVVTTDGLEFPIVNSYSKDEKKNIDVHRASTSLVNHIIPILGGVHWLGHTPPRIGAHHGPSPTPLRPAF